uniref:Secreted protein n=1 Tax=Ditylenchus dipsaci TaxID=166011 RepID=A0A915E8V0_9BILA
MLLMSGEKMKKSVQAAALILLPLSGIPLLSVQMCACVQCLSSAQVCVISATRLLFPMPQIYDWSGRRVLPLFAYDVVCLAECPEDEDEDDCSSCTDGAFHCSADRRLP